MGTRHLICIYHAGRFIVAQYGHWDGYPGGAGVAILRFLKAPNNISRLRSGLQHIKISTEKYYCIRACDQNTYLGSSQFLPALAEAGEKGGEVEVGMDLDFATDPLFCEWSYVIDLDEGCLEAYKSDHDNLLVGRQPEIGKGRLREVEGIMKQFLVARWTFGEAMEEDEWERTCFAPEKEAWAEVDSSCGLDGEQA